MSDWAQMSEAELRDAEAPRPRSVEELAEFARVMHERSHDYGTTVYAVSLVSAAAFNLMAHLEGITGFQASCADLDVLRRTRGYKQGFMILDYEKLLYPQHCDEKHFPGWQTLLDKVGPQLAKVARKNLQRDPEHVAPRVWRHWMMISTRFPESNGDEAN